MKRDNHFVAQSYLKKWADTNNKVWSYRIIVSHKNVPYWKSSSLKSIAYNKDLYTLVFSGAENDEMEVWFDREFENPAQKPINKAISGEQLSKGDWYNIIRYVVTTPKRDAEVFFYYGVRAGYSLQFRASLSPTRTGIFSAIPDAVSPIKTHGQAAESRSAAKARPYVFLSPQ